MPAENSFPIFFEIIYEGDAGGYADCYFLQLLPRKRGECITYRRKEAARKTNPRQRRKEILRSEQARLTNKMERLITAYQEGLLTLEQLRERMPNLKQHLQAAESELQSLEMAKLDEAKYLKLAESLSGFRRKLHARAETLDVKERRQILPLLVKEILIGSDTLIIRHSVPIPHGDGGPNAPSPPNVPGSSPSQPPGYGLRTRSNHPP